MPYPKVKLTLFWKIFILFWLSFAGIFLISLLSTQLTSDSIHFRQIPPHLAAQIDKQIYRLKPLILHQDKKRHFRAKYLDKKLVKRLYLLSSDGKDFWNKPIPNILQQLDQRVVKKGKPMSAFKKQALFYGGQSIQIKGSKYRVYTFQNLSLMSRSYFGLFIREFSQNLIIAIFFVSVPLSLLLAWFFIQPINKLRGAIKQLSKDLSNQQPLDHLLNRGDEFGDLARDFAAMAQQLNKTLISKEQLLRDVSHELKSPLARLQVAVALSEKTISQSDSEKFNRVNKEIFRMNQLINQLLDFSKTDESQYQSKLQSIDLKQILNILVDDVKFEGQRNNIEFELSLAGSLTINADKAMIISCFDNILRNALHYAKGRVLIKAKSCQIENRDRVQIKIIDDGKGVEESQLERIFEAFYRPDNHRSRQTGGSGIGLAIAKKVVEFHQGKIYARNLKPTGFEIEVIFLAVNKSK